MPTCVAVDRPEARRIGRQHLVDEVQAAFVVEPELELGVGNDDAALKSVGCARARKSAMRASRTCAASLLADQVRDLRKADVLVVTAGSLLWWPA